MKSAASIYSLPLHIRILGVFSITAIITAVSFIVSVDLSADLKADSTIKLINQLKHAVNLFYSDIGSYPIEYSDVPYEKYLAHNLSRPTGSGQWQGPYIKNPLHRSDSPLGGLIRLYNYMDYANGFDLNGDGEIDTRGEGSFVTFWNVNENIAKRVNTRLEKKPDNYEWMKRGRVRYSQEAKTLSVYLAGGQ
jgi:hypothetical protein